MYAGHIVEKARVDDLYARPAHPYTYGLLNSLPRLDSKVKVKLKAIDGLPPNLDRRHCADARSCRAAPMRPSGAAPRTRRLPRSSPATRSPAGTICCR